MTSKLINSNIRKTFKRFFTGSLETILSELLQNSQRAGARQVEIETTEPSSIENNCEIVYRDNGSGIKSIASLLSLGSSEYSAEEVAKQDPMGVGFLSLLANEGVNFIFIATRDYQVELDVKKWWEDDVYALSKLEPPKLRGQWIDGIEIRLQVNQKFYKDLCKCLNSEKHYYREKNVYSGYYLMNMQIFFNHELLDNRCSLKKNEDILLATEYLGNKLTIFNSRLSYEVFDSSIKTLTVNWYGQLITQDVKTGFDIFYEVTSGTPLNPLAPIRRSIIKDEKLKDFIDYIVKKLSEIFSADILNEKITCANVSQYRKIADMYTTTSFCPWIVVERYKSYTAGDEADPCMLEDAEILAYKDNPLIVNPTVFVTTNLKDLERYDYGLSSFVNSVHEPIYFLTSGNESLLPRPEHTIVWHPGSEIEGSKNWHIDFVERGHLAIAPSSEIGDNTDCNSLVWKALEQDVYALDYPNNYELPSGECFWIGCKTPHQGLEKYGWAGFINDGENGCSEYNYENSIRELKAELTNSLTPEISLGSIKAILSKTQNLKLEDIKNCGLIFKEDGNEVEVFQVSEGGKIGEKTTAKIIL